ncbi:nitrilase/cyanide hydratase and apolipoprotein N-acyltransferase [Pochonia chlamydosporia 170]|uniref:Nitrilase/cyanide hydratase and apolipoprotein N-acyltransferase n=1 Tax=Pochonia chlamydosporia 170 TaxID=1380566 RepID=A0A179F0Z6_METCM|nr:nitrilase/cyanide hydratase and apolipoprotein N-acyltransferase [Pochonia chlamydosporia 170]OAQ59137.1 nitrilase/cyanide hydratase and apolipoprotein N-acyltransferase [Pochonia chlamydosporia 170]
MADLRIASVQFENAPGDKIANLATIRKLSANAASQGCNVVAFHECSITGYTFASKLTRDELIEVAEEVPSGPSTQELVAVAKDYALTVLAGLFEYDKAQDTIYNTYICVNGDGMVAKFRKIHPFISKHLSPGNELVVFNLLGWKAGILICYDNNVVENVRGTALLGAEILFAPHVTMCTPSTRPGAGFVDPVLWRNRDKDPTSLRAEFDGLKGRSWLMKWLPSRAYDNAMYVVFSNPIGMDDDQLKNGCSMILDPFGDIMDECRALGEDMAIAVCTRDKLQLAGGFRYKKARRPELYSRIITAANESQLKVAWM